MTLDSNAYGVGRTHEPVLAAAIAIAGATGKEPSTPASVMVVGSLARGSKEKPS